MYICFLLIGFATLGIFSSANGEKILVMSKSDPDDAIRSGNYHEYKFSGGQKCSVRLNKNGNLKVNSYHPEYDEWELVWKSDSAQHASDCASYYLHLQENTGNLVIYEEEHDFYDYPKAIWHSKTVNINVRKLYIDHECILSLEDKYGHVKWSTTKLTKTPTTVPAVSIMNPSIGLHQSHSNDEEKTLLLMRSSSADDSITSGKYYDFEFEEGNKCRIRLTKRGNFQVESYDPVDREWDLAWESKSGQRDPACDSYYMRLHKQTGNLVIKGGEPNSSQTYQAVWASDTVRENVEYLYINKECVLTLEQEDGKIEWSSTKIANLQTIKPSTPRITPTTTPTSTFSMMPTSNPNQIRFFEKNPPTTAIISTDSPTSATKTPIKSPSNAPISVLSIIFSSSPTDTPTSTPTKSPSDTPSNVPTSSPTKSPTITPTKSPTITPTKSPTITPTKLPTITPTKLPTITPTKLPTITPTYIPSITISNSPSISMLPTMRCNIDPIMRRSQILDALDDVSDPTLLRTVGTPQNSAAEWLINEDEFYVCPDNEKLVQRYVMALFYYSTGGDSWTACSKNDINCDSGQSYLSSSSECEWFGSTCDADLCMTMIDFELNNVAGTIPFEFEQLTTLEVLSLEQGGIRLTIPSNLGKLSKLRVLDLDFNEITGTIPEELYNLLELDQMDLNTNKITGTISTQVGNLSNLRLLQLYENSMTGTIPSELALLKSLVIAEFFNNTFTGFMPDEVCSNRSPDGLITGLTADCFPNPTAQISCPCCTGCALF